MNELINAGHQIANNLQELSIWLCIIAACCLGLYLLMKKGTGKALSRIAGCFVVAVVLAGAPMWIMWLHHQSQQIPTLGNTGYSNANFVRHGFNR